MKYHFKIRKEGNGYWASSIELKGCVTQANTKQELAKKMKEALNLFLAEPSDSKHLFPLPKKYAKGKDVVAVPVEPRIALAFSLRRLRILRKLTQSEVADLVGLKGTYSYQRLESASTANPEFETLIRIKKVFPELEIDDLLAA